MALLAVEAVARGDEETRLQFRSLITFFSSILSVDVMFDLNMMWFSRR